MLSLLRQLWLIVCTWEMQSTCMARWKLNICDKLSIILSFITYFSFGCRFYYLICLWHEVVMLQVGARPTQENACENDRHWNLYIKIGRFVRLPGSVSECRTAGMPIMSQCQPYATMQHCGHAAYFDRRHLARSALRPCPTACMRECLHRS